MESDKYDESEITALAVEALTTADAARSEEIYNSIVLKLQKAFNNNQKDVASELQRLSKSIESSRTTEDSFSFKQRTCESMLKISMAERHKGKPAPISSAPAKAPLPFKSLDYLYVGCKNFESDAKYYRDTLNGELIWAFEKFGAKVAAFKLAYGPIILLADHKKAPSIEPIFSVENLESAIKSLKEKGVSEIEGPLQTPNGPAYSFQDPSGNKFSLLQNDRPEAMERSYADKSNASAIRLT
jgi:hypothetical protein